MRYVALLSTLAAMFALSNPAHAQNQNDVDRCKFAGEITNADQSIAACDRVINDPKITAKNRAAALSHRCGWWWTKKDADRALVDCNEAIRADNGNAAAYLNRGHAYLSKSEFERAFTDFNETIRLDPKNIWAFTERGNLYKNKGDFDRALADFNEALRLDPNYAAVFLARGDLYKSKGDFKRAITDLNESIRLDANNAAAYFTRGRLLYMMGNNPAALEDFTKVIRFETEDATAYFNRGLAYFVLGGHPADAAADFKKASEINPKDAYAALWQELAERRGNAPGRLAEAVKQLDMTPWPAPVIRHLLGELSTEQMLSAASNTDPTTKLSQTCEANFYGGEVALVKKNKKEAQRMLKLAADNCPRTFIESTAAIAELIALR